MQLFVGVVIDNFIVLKEKLGGQGLFLTDAQQDWVKMQEMMLSISPTPEEVRPKAKYCFPEGLRVQCWDLYKKAWFEPAVMFCIIMNTLIMAITYFGEGDTYSLFIEVMNYIFALIFTVECVTKLLALGDVYFDDSWNVFDFTIVAGTNIGILLKFGAGIDVGSVATIVRTFRVGRIFRLINAAPTLKRTFNTLIITMPSLVNIGALLFLLMFIYAILGVQWYAKVRYGENIKDNANFQDFWTAMLLLVRCSTGENWNGLMYDAMLNTDCITDPPWDANVCDFVGSDPTDCVPINGNIHSLLIVYA
jgi:voltage-dependent calcium channel L type alpha-1D